MKTISEHRTRLPRCTALRAFAAALALAAVASASGTFGKVVSIGGQAADIALDESRGLLYIANYTASRIEVMKTSDRSIAGSLNIPYPGSLSISPDAQYLVVASYANFTTTGRPTNIVTIINLNSNSQQTISVASPPLGVAFGADGRALVLTTTDINLLDPDSGSLTQLTTISAVNSLVLPAPSTKFPPQIITASLGVSGDGQVIYGITNTIGFVYSVPAQAVVAGTYSASPPLGPRLVSVNQDGSLYLSGWAAFSKKLGAFAYQFTNASGALSGGSFAIDSAAGIVYAQIPLAGTPAAAPTTTTQCLPNGTCITVTVPAPAGTPAATTTAPPNLMICDLDNFTVRERLLIPENLAGRSLLNSARDTLYSISDSGVTVFPVGSLKNTAQVVPAQEDAVFQGSFCNRQPLKQQISIVDPNGGNTDFKLSLVDPTLASSVSFSATSGVTPATVTISIDPTAFQSLNGTTAAYVRIDSNSAANLQPDACPQPIGTATWATGCFRLLINNPDPDQRGTLVNVPGKLVDVLADPVRNQFFVLRQDKNQVMVFDGASLSQTATLRTSNNPTQMAVTPDGAYLLVGHNDAQIMSVFDLNTMQDAGAIRMPDGHYPRSVAVAGGAILAASRVAGPQNMISLVDFASRTATAFPSLGPYTNNINSDTVLVPAPHGAFIMAVSPDGKTMLYDANAGAFTVSRQDYTALSGAYAASDLGQFVVDNHLLDNSLVQMGLFDKGANGSSGVAFMDASTLIRTTGPVTAGATAVPAGSPLNTPGVIERINLNNLGSVATSTRTMELPLFPTATGAGSASGTTSAVSAFIRTLAPLSSGNAIVSLTQSGFTMLPANFDAATAKPQITSAVNTANQGGGLTGGSLVTVVGSNLSPVNASSSATPAPTVLANSCVTVNGLVIPLFLVSGSQINGQLPLSVNGSGQLIVYSQGGVSNPFTLTVQPTAPSVIQIPSEPGSSTLVPAIYRTEDNLLVTLTNPVHKGDQLVIYVSGLGPTSPSVSAGSPSPANPPAVALFTPAVTLAGVTLPVTFAGLTPGQIGIYQINVNVPQGITQGLNIPLTVTQGAASSTVGVRVVQ
jgi:uncharacterized protein (TIGR03437 family)